MEEYVILNSGTIISLYDIVSGYWDKEYSYYSPLAWKIPEPKKIYQILYQNGKWIHLNEEDANEFILKFKGRYGVNAKESK